MKALHGIAFVLVIIGGLNWLLVGLFNWGVADLIGLGIANYVYILVGVSAIYLAVTHKGSCKNCGACKDCTCGACGTSESQTTAQ